MYFNLVFETILYKIRTRVKCFRKYNEKKSK